MRRSILALAVASAVVLASGVVAAQKGGPKGPKVKVTQSSPKAGGGGPKVQASAAQGPKVKATSPKTTSTGPKVKSSPATTKAHGPKMTRAATTRTATPTTKTTKTKTKTHGKPAATTTTTAGGTALTLSPVQQKLQKNTNLAGKLEGRLPMGTSLMDAAEGFRNLGQFVAAVNVSNNLGISFTELKSRMVEDGMSLGQAIQAERRDVDDVAVIVRRAERDAQVIIDDADEAMKKKPAKAPKTPKPPKRDGR